MLSYIIYSHSSYKDILAIQNFFIKDIKEKKYLFIDKIDNDITYNFDKIIFYNNELNYSKRILSCMLEANIKDPYIIFIPDINIFIQKNDEDIYNIIEIMKDNNIGRFDFCNYKFMNNTKNIKYKNYLLIHNNDLTNYIYNVGSAIYNTQKYIDLLNMFDYEYRTFELQNNVQEYCLNNINCYYINCIDSNNIINAGYYHLTNIFIYIHITHNGELMPLDNNKNLLNDYLHKIYEDIINNNKFNRLMRINMH